uniref:Beta-galactoside alpha--sialyltransferase 1 n=1 Tax=Tetraselmis sp. GSL018 TaxID=582737 RepID=A0A061R9U1_9CHLO
MLGFPLPCNFANGMNCPVNMTIRNKETGYAYDSIPYDLPLPDRDLTSRFRTCAVVGNGGGSLSSALNGAAIDAHEAVFRFNDMLRLNCLDPNSPNAVLCNASQVSDTMDIQKQIESQDKKYSPYIGQRTTFRILNKKHALKLLSLGRSASATSPHFSPDSIEAFLLWHHGCVNAAPKLAREFPFNRLFMFSANLINWQVDTYSELRRNFFSLGLGPFPCYAALSSGIHGVLLALRLCERVNLFGFSLYNGSVSNPVHFRPISEQPSQAHSWSFDVLLLRLLHFSGKVNACTG